MSPSVGSRKGDLQGLKIVVAPKLCSEHLIVDGLQLCGSKSDHLVLGG